MAKKKKAKSQKEYKKISFVKQKKAGVSFDRKEKSNLSDSEPQKGGNKFNPAQFKTQHRG